MTMIRILSMLLIISFSIVVYGQEQPPVRAHHALVYDELHNLVLMTTGSTPLNGGKSFQFYNDLWQYDGKNWHPVGNSGIERSGIRLAYDSKRKKVYSFGGYANNKSLDVLQVLENGNWETVSTLPEMKSAEPGLAYDKFRDRLVVFGGSGSTEAGKGETDTWEWDGQKWEKFSGKSPEARQAFAMVYDSKRKKVVIYGGMGASPDNVFNDTWEYDGKIWQKVSENSLPSGRFSPGFAYDSKRGQLIIFGGLTKTGFVGDTWSWNGKKWQKLAEIGPKPRAMGYLAYDKKRDKVVLFGGRIGWPNDVNDTWEWDGKVWINKL